MTSSASDLDALINTITAYRLEKEAIYSKKLDDVDLHLARVDRERRKLRRERTKVEGELGDVETGIRLIQDSGSGADFSVLLSEQTELQDKLNGIDLTLARLDRERKELKKERKVIERAWNRAGPIAF